MSDPSTAVAALGTIDHVAVVVHDADVAARTFAALSGHQVIGDEEVSAAGVRLVYLGLAHSNSHAAVLQLVQPLGEGPISDHLAVHGEGLHHVCFRTDAIADAVLQRGTALTAIFTGGRQAPCAFLVATPHGVRVELTQRDQKENPR